MLKTLQIYRLHIALFVVAYSVGLMHFQPVGQQQTVFASMMNSVGRDATPGFAISADSPLHGVSSRQVDRSKPRSAAAVQPAQEQIDPVTPLVDTTQLPEETRQEVSEFGMQATGAVNPGERGKAIVKLRNAAKTPESIQALTNVVSGDQSAQNRLLAVTALLNLARQGDEDGSVHAALRNASADIDPRVAMRAQQAIQMLAGANDVDE